jgi:hypothetical protein
MASGETNSLEGVWGSSGSDVFAVGDNGTILHYDGSTWSPMASGTTNNLFGVWGSSETNVFAVGSNGTILHYNGSTWSSMKSGTTNRLEGVWGSSGTDVFAVGEYGSILHYSEKDMDNDGIPDDVDECPESNFEATITIGGCDTGVQNQLFNNGCTMSDLIAECNANNNTRFGFLKCVNHLTQQWKAFGIGIKEKWAMLRCAFGAK